MPLAALTHLAGSVAKSRASRWWIPFYMRVYGIDPDEAEKAWREYASLSEFFSRRLHAHARPAPLDAGLVLSPVDGIVREMGQLQNDRLLQAKGVPYAVADLLVEGDGFAGGEYITLYLSPKDYHRIHVPVAAKLVSVRRVHGSFFPVNRIGVSAIPGLYANNERVVVHLQTQSGRCALVAVGATVVGSVHWQEQASYEQGEECGWFELGSTVILMFAPGLVEWSVQTGAVVRARAPLGREK